MREKKQLVYHTNYNIVHQYIALLIDKKDLNRFDGTCLWLFIDYDIQSKKGVKISKLWKLNVTRVSWSAPQIIDI